MIMGLFDTVWVKCPKCGAPSGFQSKSGECGLNNYQLDTAPLDAMQDVNRHAPNECEKCGTVFKVNVQKRIAESRGV